MKNKTQLDARLSAIMDMVRPDSVVADIGCDHAYLACALVETGIASRVFACDANPGPLERAKKNISDYCLSESIETVLTNGLSGLPHTLIDTFVIAGMGGDMIGEILLAHDWTRDTRFHFILQPMTKADKLRQIIFENGFAISKEIAVISDNKLYTVMSVLYTNRLVQYASLTCYTGCHLESDDFFSKLYLEQVLNRLIKKTRGLNASKSAENTKKAAEYEYIINKIRERIK